MAFIALIHKKVIQLFWSLQKLIEKFPSKLDSTFMLLLPTQPIAVYYVIIVLDQVTDDFSNSLQKGIYEMLLFRKCEMFYNQFDTCFSSFLFFQSVVYLALPITSLNKPLLKLYSSDMNISLFFLLMLNNKTKRYEIFFIV